MAFKTPKEVRDSTTPDLRKHRGIGTSTPQRLHDPEAFKRRYASRHSHHWPNAPLNHDALDAAKELICRAPHPNAYYVHLRREIRFNILRWSRASYIDIRAFHNGFSTGRGVLIHLDIMKAVLPHLIEAVHKLEAEDGREPGQKVDVKLLFDKTTPLPGPRDWRKKNETTDV